MGRENLPESERLLAEHLVRHGMARPEHVEECVALINRLASHGVSPLPTLEDLLRQKGYLSNQAQVETMRLTPSAPAPGSLTPPPTMPGAALAASDDPANTFGKYVRESKLGAGGMGEVWRAWDRELGRWVAIKFLKSENPDEFARFQREAQTAAKLVHPNIAAVYEVGHHESRHYIAMQYVRGKTLAAIPKARRRLLVELVRDAARAVHYAHEQGVIHRDLKPQNLMAEGNFDGGGPFRVYVMDFGLAKQTSIESSISVSGMILGTPSYMSPEQARGKAPDVGPRSDVYSLGATLFDLLLGRPPHVDSEVYALIRRIIDEEPPPLKAVDPSIDMDLGTIVAKCLEKDPSRRYQTAGDLADDLDRYLTGEPIVARPTTVLYRAQKWVMKRRALSAALAAIVLVAAGSGAILIRTAMKRAAENRAIALLQQASAHASEAKIIWRVKTARREQWESLYDKAIAEADQAIAEFPEMAQAHYTLGEIQEARGRWLEATRAFDRAIELDPNLAKGWYLRGLCHLEMYLTQLIQTAAMRQGATGLPEIFDADRTRVAPLRARTLEDLRVYTRLKGEGAKKTTEMQIAEAAFLLADQKFQEAEKACDALLKRDQTDERVWLFKLLAQVAQQRLLQALASLQKLIDAAPNQGRAYVARGFMRGRLGNKKAGMADLDRAVELEPDSPEVRLLAGVARATLMDFDGAITDLDEAVRQEPGAAATWISRSWVRAALRDWEGCLADANKGLELDPRAAKGYWFRAWAQMEAGRLEEALKNLNRAAELDPKNGGILSDVADVHFRLGNFEQSRKDCLRAIRLSPDDSRAYIYRARICAKTGDWKSAQDEMDALMKEGPIHGEMFFLRGRCQLQMGYPRGAHSDFQKAVKAAPALKSRVLPFLNRAHRAMQRK